MLFTRQRDHELEFLKHGPGLFNKVLLSLGNVGPHSYGCKAGLNG
jgi:hypothetical protein